MSAFCEDDRVWDRFAGTTRLGPGHRLRVRSFEWRDDGAAVDSDITETVPEMLAKETASNVRLRIVLLASRPRSDPELEDFKSLLERYSVPVAPLVERVQSAAHSFGSSMSIDRSVEVAWCHFLTKDISAEYVGDQLRIVDYGALKGQNNAAGDQASSSWIVSDFVLHVRKTPSRVGDTAECVTLLCFDPPPSLTSRLKALLAKPAWKDALAEPYLLYGIVFEELYLLVDRLAWTLADVFREQEQSTLNRARREDAKTGSIDFTGLHNVAKHCIFVKEAVEAAMLTLDAMSSHLVDIRHETPLALSRAAVHSLQYRRRTFQSTQLRLASLEKRMSNIISLSFNLVTQQDSRIMQVDSIAMKAIALLTLIFLPPAGVAQIFSMPFFSVDFSKHRPALQAAGSIWVFFVVAVPLTAVMLVLWRWWYKRAKHRRMEGMPEKVTLAQRKRKPSSGSLRPLLSGTELSQWTAGGSSRRAQSSQNGSFGGKQAREDSVPVRHLV